jgi:predicted enzyme related to lactoylglutathione lyase
MLTLEFVPLPVTDMDRALAFYKEQVGFTLTSTTARPTTCELFSSRRRNRRVLCNWSWMARLDECTTCAV